MLILDNILLNLKYPSVLSLSYVPLQILCIYGISHYFTSSLSFYRFSDKITSIFCAVLLSVTVTDSYFYITKVIPVIPHWYRYPRIQEEFLGVALVIFCTILYNRTKMNCIIRYLLALLLFALAIPFTVIAVNTAAMYAHLSYTKITLTYVYRFFVYVSLLTCIPFFYLTMYRSSSRIRLLLSMYALTIANVFISVFLQ